MGLWLLKLIQNLFDQSMKTQKSIEILPVKTRSQLKEFIHLPAKLHKDHSRWVPPIYKHEWKYFNHKTNIAYTYCDVELALAYYNNKLTGRIMGIINHKYNHLKNESSARFSCFECINDPDIANSLFDHIEQWARSKGAKTIFGPFGMYYHDPIGCIIDGFDNEVSVSQNYNYEYIPELIVKHGYEKKYDLVAYKIDVELGLPGFYERIYDRLVSKGNITESKIQTKKDLKSIIQPLFQLLNECFSEIDGYTPLDEREIQMLAKQYLPVLDPELIKIAKLDKEMIGFMIAMPNISEGIRRSKGYLFPFGIFKILKSAKDTNQIDFLFGGVKKKYRGIGVDVMGIREMYKTAVEKKIKIFDTHLEMESNYKVRREMEKIGGVIHKKYRVFQKPLTAASEKTLL